jgi:hypothetical protein
MTTDSESGCIYALVDPRTNEPKYVGATKNPKQRLTSHKHQSFNNELANWIEELSEEGYEPEMQVIRVKPIEELRDAEREMLERLADEWDLLNKTLDSNYSPQGRPSKSKTANRRRPRIPEPVCEEAERVKDEQEYSSLGDAIRHMCRSGEEYDV